MNRKFYGVRDTFLILYGAKIYELFNKKLHTNLNIRKEKGILYRI
jgi:hypothetical protein